jgi:hypothetical protein
MQIYLRCRLHVFGKSTLRTETVDTLKIHNHAKGHGVPTLPLKCDPLKKRDEIID